MLVTALVVSSVRIVGAGVSLAAVDSWALLVEAIAECGVTRGSALSEAELGVAGLTVMRDQLFGGEGATVMQQPRLDCGGEVGVGAEGQIGTTTATQAAIFGLGSRESEGYL